MPAQSVSDADSLKAAEVRLADLPVTCDLTLAYAASLVIALLVVVASVAGIFFGSSLYPTEEMFLLKLPTDLFTLIVGLPLLLASMWSAWRGRLLGLLCWPGVLLYMLYIYVAYAIGVPFSVLFLVYVALAALSACTLIGLVASIDAKVVGEWLAGAVPARVAGGILIGISILFTLMNLNMVVTALTNPTPDDLLNFSVWIADFVVLAPAWFIGGVLLWRRKALGYVAGTGLFLQGSMIFVGPVFVLAFPAFYNASPLPVFDIVFMLVVDLICFIPLALFARGIIRS